MTAKIRSRFTRSTLLSAAAICLFSTPISPALSQETPITQGSTTEQGQVQENQGSPKPVRVVTGEELDKKTEDFLMELTKYKQDEVTRLRLTNQVFSVVFIVSGITLTFASTALGAVESQNTQVKKWTKVAIPIIGGLAVFFQALNSAFPVTKRAGEYALIKAKITVLEFKLMDVRNDSQLKDIKNEFYDLVEQSGQAESESN